uniref:Nuclear speckle splicing regulatory protein 1 (Trinotate prediction) n=1 Tax=Myxobolus squamalis TaxID=59785 RepID=A0A6B2FXF6_MYXSQ
MSELKKKFGLILKNKEKVTKNVSICVGNIFGIDEDLEPKPVDARKIETNIGSSISIKLSKAELEKALDEDASICQYDELFDKMEEKKKLADPRRSDESKKPKYIENLLQTAAFRKREKARRMDRKIQKEREEEGDNFDDTEVYVTETYRKKLEERESEEKILKLKEKIDQSNSVTKKGDMSHFYRQYLLKEQDARSIAIEAPITVKKNETSIDEVTQSDSGPSKTPVEEKLAEKPERKFGLNPMKPASNDLELATFDADLLLANVKKDKYEIYKIRNDKTAIENAMQRYIERRKNNILEKFVIIDNRNYND